MGNWSGILSVIEAKGWHLYLALPESDLSKIVSQGKAKSIERNVPYLMLPVVGRDNDVNEVQAQMASANRTNQLPTYNDKTNSPGQIEFITITEQGLNVKTKGLDDIYSFDVDRMEDAVKRHFSNYNVHYFSSIDELGEYFKRRGIGEQIPATLPKQLRWELVHPDRAEPPSGALFMIYPSDPSHFLFRGQIKRYKPCHPTSVRNVKTPANTFRHLSRAEQASVVLNLIRTEWFNENLRQTAAMQWMSDERIVFDKTAVAQHYGLPTGYIDLSQSFEVSSFFACCKYDSTRRKWQPVQEGEGVVYMVDRTQTPVGEFVKPICLQPFPRPSEQWGWVHEILLGQDFDTFPHVRKFIFKHDAAASQRILERFDQGAALFPPDPLSKVADRIKQSHEIPMVVSMGVVKDLINDPFGLPGEQAQGVLAMVEQETGVTFLESCDVLVMDNRVIGDMNANWTQRKIPLSDGEGIGVRLVRTKNPDDPDSLSKA